MHEDLSVFALIFAALYMVCGAWSAFFMAKRDLRYLKPFYYGWRISQWLFIALMLSLLLTGLGVH